MSKFKHFQQGKEKESEKQAFHEYLKTHYVTAYEASKALGIDRAKLCWYKRQLQQENLLIEIGERRCNISGCKAKILCTNPNIIAERLRRFSNSQLSLAI